MTHPLVAEGLRQAAEVMDPEIMAELKSLVREGTATWVPDPEVDNTIGLVIKGISRYRAVAVVYLKCDGIPTDFELDEKLLESLGVSIY